MEYLPNGITAAFPDGVFPLSTDSMVLADFTRLPPDARVLDLGAGCGTLGLLLAAKDPGCHVTGVELSAAAHQAALENIRANLLESRLCSICADIRNIPTLVAPGSFSCCVSNPPYFAGGKRSERLPLARQETDCTPEDLFRAASHALRYGGDFFLVHRPERLAELCAAGSRNRLEPKRLRLVRHKTGGAIRLILLSCRKGGKPGLQIDEIALQNPDGSPTADYCRIYHKEN